VVGRPRTGGVLAPGARIVESTSGTLGLGLALAGTVYGHPVTLVTDPGMEPIIQHMLAAFGAQLDEKIDSVVQAICNSGVTRAAPMM